VQRPYITLGSAVVLDAASHGPADRWRWVAPDADRRLQTLAGNN
jgi:hypothetical protein